MKKAFGEYATNGNDQKCNWGRRYFVAPTKNWTVRTLIRTTHMTDAEDKQVVGIEHCFIEAFWKKITQLIRTLKKMFLLLIDLFQSNHTE